MCMCAAEIKVCTYAGRVRASLALDAGKRTRRPCYNVFTSFSQTTPDVCWIWAQMAQCLICARQISNNISSPDPVQYVPAWHVLQVADSEAPATQYSMPTSKRWRCEIENNQFANLKTQLRSLAVMKYLLVNMHTLIVEGHFARLMQKSMLRRYTVCSWHHW